MVCGSRQDLHYRCTASYAKSLHVPIGTWRFPSAAVIHRSVPPATLAICHATLAVCCADMEHQQHTAPLLQDMVHPKPVSPMASHPPAMGLLQAMAPQQVCHLPAARVLLLVSCCSCLAARVLLHVSCCTCLAAHVLLLMSCIACETPRQQPVRQYGSDRKHHFSRLAETAHDLLEWCLQSEPYCLTGCCLLSHMQCKTWAATLLTCLKLRICGAVWTIGCTSSQHAMNVEELEAGYNNTFELCLCTTPELICDMTAGLCWVHCVVIKYIMMH